jgi:hypothetical protein
VSEEEGEFFPRAQEVLGKEGSKRLEKAFNSTRELVSKQLELATTELRADLKRETGVLAGLGVAGLAVLATLNLLLVTAVLAQAQWMAGWMAGLLLSACTLFAAATIGLVSWRRHVSAPLERTRRTVKDDVQWSKEKLA